MIGRREFGLAGLAAAATVAMKTTSFGKDESESSRSAHMGAFDKCAEACSDCQRECDGCAHHCATMLSQGHAHHMATLQTCQDCADLCAAAAQIVAREGAFANLACHACAEACARCGKECEKHSGDKVMARCAEECHRCEKACREMVKEDRFK